MKKGAEGASPLSCELIRSATMLLPNKEIEKPATQNKACFYVLSQNIPLMLKYCSEIIDVSV